MGKTIQYTPEQIATAQRDAWHKQLRKIAWSRSPNYLHSLAILLYMGLWAGLCVGALYLLGYLGMLPLNGYWPMVMIFGNAVVVGIIAFLLFGRIDNFIERRFEHELRKVFAQFDEPYPYVDGNPYEENK